MQIVCETLSQECPTQERADRVAQVVQYLPSKGKVLSLNASTAKGGGKKKGNMFNLNQGH
jgi:hypothetical protein